MGNLRPDTFTRLLAHPSVSVVPRVFCELGTFEGKTAALAAKHFREVHTVEASPVYYERAKAAYWDLGIHFHLGDSRTLLANLCEVIAEPVCFVNDANWWPYPDVFESFPLWDDLATMATRDYADIILVDEVHRFGDTKPTLYWKDVSVERIAACFPGHREAVVIDNLFAVFR